MSRAASVILREGNVFENTVEVGGAELMGGVGEVMLRFNFRYINKYQLVPD